jgi:hypothetical protein
VSTLVSCMVVTYVPQCWSILAYSKTLGHTYQNDAAGSELFDLGGIESYAHLQNAFFILMLAAWGCIGITQTSFGFHNIWEFWAYQAFYGVFVCPWYAISVRCSNSWSRSENADHRSKQ